MRGRRLLWMMPLLGLGVAAGAQDAAVTARETLASAQAGPPVGKLTVSIKERFGKYEPNERLDDTRKRLTAEPGQDAEGVILYNAEGTLKDLSLRPMGQRPATRKRISEYGGLLHQLMEAKVEGEEQRVGHVVKAPVLSPADALISGRMVRAAEGMEWTAVRQEAQELTLEGKRGAERHILLFATDGKPRLREWTLTRPRSAPDGTSFEQRYRCQATASAEGLSSIEEWVFSLAPVNTVTYRLTEVKKAEPLPGVKPEEIRLRFPRGTTITDTRFGAPVEYELTEEGLPEDRVASTVRALAANRALPGQPAPDLTLTDLKGKPFRLADQKGKVLLLFWFSSGSRLAGDVAAMVQELHQDYRRRGVQVVGLDVAEEGDAAKKAEAFGKRYKWSFPVVVDTGEALRRIGYELAVPKVAIVDGTGKLVYAEPGFDVETVTAQLNRLVK